MLLHIGSACSACVRACVRAFVFHGGRVRPGVKLPNKTFYILLGLTYYYYYFFFPPSLRLLFALSAFRCSVAFAREPWRAVPIESSWRGPEGRATSSRDTRRSPVAAEIKGTHTAQTIVVCARLPLCTRLLADGYPRNEMWFRRTKSKFPHCRARRHDTHGHVDDDTSSPGVLQSIKRCNLCGIDDFFRLLSSLVRDLPNKQIYIEQSRHTYYKHTRKPFFLRRGRRRARNKHTASQIRTAFRPSDDVTFVPVYLRRVRVEKENNRKETCVFSVSRVRDVVECVSPYMHRRPTELKRNHAETHSYLFVYSVPPPNEWNVDRPDRSVVVYSSRIWITKLFKIRGGRRAVFYSDFDFKRTLHSVTVSHSPSADLVNIASCANIAIMRFARDGFKNNTDFVPNYFELLDYLFRL